MVAVPDVRVNFRGLDMFIVTIEHARVGKLLPSMKLHWKENGDAKVEGYEF